MPKKLEKTREKSGKIQKNLGEVHVYFWRSTKSEISSETTVPAEIDWLPGNALEAPWWRPGSALVARGVAWLALDRKVEMQI